MELGAALPAAAADGTAAAAAAVAAVAVLPEALRMRTRVLVSPASPASPASARNIFATNLRPWQK